MFDDGLDPRELPTERLEAEIATRYARISAETCEWLAMVAELDSRNAYLSDGCRSCADWLSLHCGVGLRAAQEHVRVANRLEELTEIRDAFARGELTYSKVRALTRIADHESEKELLETARNTTAAQLERIVRAYRRAVPPDEPDAIDRRRYASIGWDEDGSLLMRARMSPEEGAILVKALELARQQIMSERPREVHAAEDGTERLRRPIANATNADALVRVAENALADAAHGATGGDTHQVLVHVDVELLLGGERDAREGRSEIEGVAGIAPETARRLACDASVVTSIERDGGPLSVGRKTRSIPPAIRRALRARDGGCRFPGCNSRRFVDGHHIEHWARGGETSLDNLLTLCRHHHRLVHEGGFSVERAAGDRVVFRRRDGTEIPASPRPPTVDGRVLRRPSAIRSHKDVLLGAPLAPCSARCRGEKLDFEHVMFCLLQRFNRSERPSSVADAGASP
jgi:hypothetical protein